MSFSRARLQLPISNPDIPVKILEALTEAGVRFVVLHGEEKIGTADLDSDVDLAVDLVPRAIVEQVTPGLEDRGLLVALIWRYDIGGSASVFVTTRDGSAGAQIDMMYDPHGRGRYGLRTDVVMANQRPGIRYPVPAPLDQALYLLRKARSKGRTFLVEQILSGFESEGSDANARERARELFSPGVAADVVNEIDRGSRRRAIRPWRGVATVGRLIGRVVQPIGYWVELAGNSSKSAVAASELTKRFGVWLVRVETSSRPAGQLASVGWWLRKVMPVRMRPAVYISATGAPPGRRPSADMTLAVDPDQDVADLAGRIVAGMAARTLK